MAHRTTVRMVAKLLAVKAELVRRRHEPKAAVRAWLQKVTSGYYRYHAVPGNLPLLLAFRHRLRRLWRIVLIRRSQRGGVSWERLSPLWTDGFRSLVSYILIPWNALTPLIQGGSRMRKSARTVLCGGCRAIGIPTATPKSFFELSLSSNSHASPI